MKQYLISIIALALIIVHLFIPDVGVDGITIVLLLLGFLPFFFPYLKSLELPGGFKITLKDAKRALAKINPGTPIAPGLEAITKQSVNPLGYLKDIAETDPNLALVGFRIELEKRIRVLAKENNLNTRGSLTDMIKELRETGLIDGSSSSGLLELVQFANRAAHGAKVSPQAINWVLDYTPAVLETLK